MQHRLVHRLSKELRPLGVRLAYGEGLTIKRVTLPHELLRSICEAKRHELTLDVLDRYKDSKIDKAVVAELVNSSVDNSRALPLLMWADYFLDTRVVGANGRKNGQVERESMSSIDFSTR